MSSQPNPNIGMFRDTHLWKMGYKELQRMNANYERIVDRYLELQRLIDRLRATRSTKRRTRLSGTCVPRWTSRG